MFPVLWIIFLVGIFIIANINVQSIVSYKTMVLSSNWMHCRSSTEFFSCSLSPGAIRVCAWLAFPTCPFFCSWVLTRTRLIFGASDFLRRFILLHSLINIEGHFMSLLHVVLLVESWSAGFRLASVPRMDFEVAAALSFSWILLLVFLFIFYFLVIFYLVCWFLFSFPRLMTFCVWFICCCCYFIIRKGVYSLGST